MFRSLRAIFEGVQGVQSNCLEHVDPPNETNDQEIKGDIRHFDVFSEEHVP